MKKNQGGFTLIELLIATSLLSAVIYIGSLSYSLFAQNWNTRLAGFKETAASTRNLYLFRNVIQSSLPLVIDTRDSWQGIYFGGQSSEIRGISSEGVFDSSQPVIYRLFFDARAKSVVYNEVTAEAVLLLHAEQPIDYQYEITLFENVDSVNFSYFGWPTLSDKISVTTSVEALGQRPAWFRDYLGWKRRLLPKIVKISLEFGNQEVLEFSTGLVQGAEYVLAKSRKENS